MKVKVKAAKKTEQEVPVGIVISQGLRAEQPPTVFAYVWGPAPETSEQPRESRVA